MPVWAIDKAYYHLVILGDPHLPGKYISSKEKVIKNINTWTDVDEAIAIGDICEISGTNEEYATAKIFSKAWTNRCILLWVTTIIYTRIDRERRAIS